MKTQTKHRIASLTLLVSLIMACASTVLSYDEHGEINHKQMYICYLFYVIMIIASIFCIVCHWQKLRSKSFWFGKKNDIGDSK